MFKGTKKYPSGIFAKQSLLSKKTPSQVRTILHTIKPSLQYLEHALKFESDRMNNSVIKKKTF